MASSTSNLLKFTQMKSCVDVSFWSELTDRKLNKYKLSDKPVSVQGWFSASRYTQLPGQLTIDASSFIDDQQPTSSALTPSTTEESSVKDGADLTASHTSSTANTQRAGQHAVPGTLTLFNTIEAFKTCNKQQLLKQEAARIWQAIVNGDAERNPQLLCKFHVITFADLKHFHFTYWFMIPALKPPAAYQVKSSLPLVQVLGQDSAQEMAVACDKWRGVGQQNSQSQPQDTGTASNTPAPRGDWAFIIDFITATSDSISTSGPLQADMSAINDETASQQTRPTGAPAGSVSSDAIESVRTYPLSEWKTVVGDHGGHRSPDRQWMIAVSDISNIQQFPGWPLRNLLLMVARNWGVTDVQVLCLRDTKGRTDASRCQVLHVSLPDIPASWCSTEPPEAVGWEADTTGKLAPIKLDLSAQLSPLHLAEQAVDLNLHLMRWRAAPELDVGRTAQTKCLLLGAGTLGCAVARTLQGWGVRHITFVDSSRVSYSNPVRQSLYTFEDCLEGGKPKAQAAAEALRQIFPAVNASHVCMTIPMPGHPPSSPAQEADLREAAEKLDRLVQDHDVIFLLTDTRESRWLPSLLAAAHNKLAVTSAVGFDSFVVMRHGCSPGAHASQHGPRLGCYFCNDVVAPLNSTRDRTLDQQCTVARPGLAPMAGALAVELMVALQQHPSGLHAPAAGSRARTQQQQTSAAAAGVLGEVPHMIRGQLFSFSQTCMEGHAFSQCTACSPAIVQQYKQNGWQFLLPAFNNSRYLEDLTGLTALHQAMDDAMLMSGEDDDDGDDNEASKHTEAAPGSNTSAAPGSQSAEHGVATKGDVQGAVGSAQNVLNADGGGDDHSHAAEARAAADEDDSDDDWTAL